MTSRNLIDPEKLFRAVEKSNAATWARQVSSAPVFSPSDEVFSAAHSVLLQYRELEMSREDARVIQAYEAAYYLESSQGIETFVVQPAAKLLLSDRKLGVPEYIRRAAAAQLAEESNHTLKQWFVASAIEKTWPCIRNDDLGAHVRRRLSPLTSAASDARVLGRGIAVELIEGAVLNGQQDRNLAEPMKMLFAEHSREEAVHRLYARYEADAVAEALRGDERALGEFKRGLEEGAGLYATPATTPSELALTHLGWPRDQARILAAHAAQQVAREAVDLVNRSLRVLTGTHAGALIEDNP